MFKEVKLSKNLLGYYPFISVVIYTGLNYTDKEVRQFFPKFKLEHILTPHFFSLHI